MTSFITVVFNVQITTAIKVAFTDGQTDGQTTGKHYALRLLLPEET